MPLERFMPIPAPAIEWPTGLFEKGPPEDPAILLAGKAQIGDVAFQVMALRMREGRREPDFRSDVSPGAYDPIISAMVDDLEDLVDSTDLKRIPIGRGQYLLWVVPEARE